jgi:molecular chaperone DnaK
MEKWENDQIRIEVLNTDGVEKLGGEDIDEVLMAKFRTLIGIQYDDIANETELKLYQEKLKKTAMETKENLSVDEEYDAYETFTINGTAKELDMELSRDEFATWMKTNNILGQIEDAIDRSLMDVGDDGLEADEIDRIILAGGSSNIPLIHYLTEKYFSKKPESRKNLGELVGHGAGIVAGLTADKNLNYEIIRKVSKNVGIAKGNKFEMVLPKNTNYGVESDLHTISIRNIHDGELRITFYEGDSSIIEHCEIVGSITIDVSSVTSNEIGISLEKDESEGRLVYHIYDNDVEIETNNIENK